MTFMHLLFMAEKGFRAFYWYLFSVLFLDTSLYPICYHQVDHITISNDTSLTNLVKPL